jgi:hypothetical protein
MRSFISWDPFVDRLEDPNLLRNAFPRNVFELDLVLIGSWDKEKIILLRDGPYSTWGKKFIQESKEVRRNESGQQRMQMR